MQGCRVSSTPGSSLHACPALKPVHAAPHAALQWLKRRGPPMTEGARQRLARLRRMRLVTSGGRLRQIHKGMLLPAGSRLLIPKGAMQPHVPGINHAAVKGAPAPLHLPCSHLPGDQSVLSCPAIAPSTRAVPHASL